MSSMRDFRQDNLDDLKERYGDDEDLILEVCGFCIIINFFQSDDFDNFWWIFKFLTNFPFLTILKNFPIFYDFIFLIFRRQEDQVGKMGLKQPRFENLIFLRLVPLLLYHKCLAYKTELRRFHVAWSFFSFEIWLLAKKSNEPQLIFEIQGVFVA